MFAKQYSHRLPADYDMAVIRRRAEQLGPLWDRAEGLLFKAFIAQERGLATGNVYASVYLWADPLKAADFLLGEGFQKVLDSFGRPHTYAAAPGSTHIFNLGHGISQFTPPEHVSHLVDEVHAHSRRLRAA